MTSIYVPVTSNPEAEPEQISVRIVRHKEVREKLKISDSQLFKMISSGQFPRPFTLFPGGRAVGWLESDIDKWIFERNKTYGGDQ